MKTSNVQVHEAGDDAEWRRTRLTTHQFLARQVETGRKISPIFKVFGIFTYLFRVDWLHAVDQGVGADFMGNVFESFLHKMPGNNIDERCKGLADRMFAYYSRQGTEDTLKELKYKTFKRKTQKRPPKLRGSAAQIRALIPFVKELAEELADDTVPKELAIKVAARHLHNCYQALSNSSAAFRDEAFYHSGRDFALQCHALFLAGDGVSFKAMPKMHLFLELCSQPGVVPNKFWCYRDEDFGGSVAKQSKMKGRWKNLTAFSGHAFDMFAMKNPVPRIVTATF